MSPAIDQQAQLAEIAKIIHEQRTDTGPVLAVEVQAIQRAHAKGYPRELYHETLPPQLAINKIQEERYAEMGYVRNYIHHDYPRVMFRRNMDAKFEKEDFLEQRTVGTPGAEKHLLGGRVPAGCSQWVGAPDLLDPLPDANGEDPQLKISRLEGQLEEARRAKKEGKAA